VPAGCPLLFVEGVAVAACPASMGFSAGEGNGVARKKSLDEGRVPREEILQRASLLFYE